jgi:hypothetical protein
MLRPRVRLRRRIPVGAQLRVLPSRSISRILKRLVRGLIAGEGNREVRRYLDLTWGAVELELDGFSCLDAGFPANFAVQAQEELASHSRHGGVPRVAVDHRDDGTHGS